MLTTTLLSVFQHSNIRTPQWLGATSCSGRRATRITTSVACMRGNYSDLPLFDLLFGTFHNPRDFAPLAGFYDGASRRIIDMLLVRDVSNGADACRADAGSTDPRRLTEAP